VDQDPRHGRGHRCFRAPKRSCRRCLACSSFSALMFDAFSAVGRPSRLVACHPRLSHHFWSLTGATVDETREPARAARNRQARNADISVRRRE
jgi:hypothetical protein